jgi:hypothetical protein
MTKRESPEARIFAVETRFQQMAKREGGVPRERAIERAQTEVEEVKPGFDEWFDRELEQFAAFMNAVQAGKHGPDWIEAASFRSRQLRDSATTLGFELLAFIASSLCEILGAIEAGHACNMDSIICHLDALLLARQTPYRHMKPEQVPELIQGLQRVVKHVAL